MAKVALPTIFFDPNDEDRLYIASRHLEITRTEFCEQAIMKALAVHEAKHGGIMSTGTMEIKASDKAKLPPTTPIGTDEQQELRKNKK